MSPGEAQFFEDAFLAVSCVIMVLGFCSWVCTLPPDTQRNEEYKEPVRKSPNYKQVNKWDRR